ncbi:MULTISPECIES: hypothetical protein [Corynebacterium]|uniref:Uncharacterized protein n=1 Tax=Corynebacterium ramonii TaxID=3026968 RepID=A0ABM5RTX1_9CORY|nr:MULTISPECIES: hypothetical protein [Corynebacterium]AEG82402.1 hypothetical protein CULC809_01875 [Corynebacterium ulcerans 809]AIT89914.1 Hypothetical protein Cul210932_2003 [Corynebacterium ulcerans]AIU33442.1 Hypothetical protein CulFRC11_1893 [Corynebacterium ramonii FRC0011]ALD95709.1 Hypothetical protein Cul131001_2035 [Corynebacterium ulcerans]ESU57243.1 hypothetical protein D881_11120 [Corynebacterium ulcerans NCTC 12077]
MFTAIHNFVLDLLDLDFLSSQPKDYFLGAWDSFLDIFDAIKDGFSS